MCLFDREQGCILTFVSNVNLDRIFMTRSSLRKMTNDSNSVFRVSLIFGNSPWVFVTSNSTICFVQDCCWWESNERDWEEAWDGSRDYQDDEWGLEDGGARTGLINKQKQKSKQRKETNTQAQYTGETNIIWMSHGIWRRQNWIKRSTNKKKKQRGGGARTGLMNEQTDERNKKWIRNKQTNNQAEERNKQAQ